MSAEDNGFLSDKEYAALKYDNRAERVHTIRRLAQQLINTCPQTAVFVAGSPLDVMSNHAFAMNVVKVAMAFNHVYFPKGFYTLSKAKDCVTLEQLNKEHSMFDYLTRTMVLHILNEVKTYIKGDEIVKANMVGRKIDDLKSAIHITIKEEVFAKAATHDVPAHAYEGAW